MNVRSCGWSKALAPGKKHIPQPESEVNVFLYSEKSSCADDK